VNKRDVCEVSYGEVLGDKTTMYITVTYWGLFNKYTYWIF